MFRISIASLSLLLLPFLQTSRSQEPDVRIRNGTAPNGKFRVERTPEGSVDILNTTNQSRCQVVPEESQVSNLGVECRWSASGTNLACVLSWGTKMSSIELFSKGSSGEFRRIEFSPPDLNTYFSNIPDDVIVEYALGAWHRGSAFVFIKGGLSTTSEGAERHHLLRCRVRVKGRRAVIESVKRLGAFDASQALNMLEHVDR